MTGEVFASSSASIPADDTDAQAVVPEDIVSTHGGPKEMLIRQNLSSRLVERHDARILFSESGE